MRTIKVHGIYPFVGRRWLLRQSIEPLEAARLLGVLEEATPEEKEKAKRGQLYLFLNKGYVILGPNAPNAPDEVHLVIAEGATDGEVGRSLPIGTRAVYLHDGCYYLIEVGHPCKQCGGLVLAEQVYCGAGCCARGEAGEPPQRREHV